MIINTQQLVEKLDAYCKAMRISKAELYQSIGITSAAFSLWRTGKNEPTRKNLSRIEAFIKMPLSQFMGADLNDDRFQPPMVTDDVVTFPVLGEVAAGYDHVAYEDYTGDTISIPREYLSGRKESEHFVLRISGDSMYPMFHDGDLILVLRQSTMDGSGRIGVVCYDSDKATLKRVDYVMGEDWMRLTPINPNYPPITIEGEDLERCRVIGVPRLLLRDLKRL